MNCLDNFDKLHTIPVQFFVNLDGRIWRRILDVKTARTGPTDVWHRGYILTRYAVQLFRVGPRLKVENECACLILKSYNKIHTNKYIRQNCFELCLDCFGYFPHVDSVVKLCFFHLRQLRLIRRSLTDDTTHALVRALVHTRLDYCNGVLAGLPINQVSEASVASAWPSERDWPDEGRPSLAWRLEARHLQTLCTGIQVSDRSRTILPNVVVCAVVDRAGSCQPPISKHEYLAPSTNKNKKRSMVRVDFSTPAQRHGTISPLLLESWTNRSVFKINLKTFLFRN